MKQFVDRALLAGLAAAGTILAAAPAFAQGVTVQTVDSPSPALGNVGSAASGETLFRVAADSGAVTRISGSGYRIGGGSTRPLVTLACGSDAACATDEVTVTVSSLGSTGRAGTVGVFTVSAGSAVINGSPSGTDPLSFTVAPIGQNATRTFYLGMDIPILGNDSAEATGPATARFEVSAAFAGGGTPGTGLGTASATVFRPISITAPTNLSFGALIRPNSGSGTISLDPATGDAMLTGIAAIGAAPVRARFVVNGEGGQSFSVSVPDTVEMSGPGGDLIATLHSDAGGAQTLDGSPGGPGTAAFHVGGDLTVPAATITGLYSGIFQVTVQYN